MAGYGVEVAHFGLSLRNYLEMAGDENIYPPPPPHYPVSIPEKLKWLKQCRLKQSSPHKRISKISDGFLCLQSLYSCHGLVEYNGRMTLGTKIL